MTTYTEAQLSSMTIAQLADLFNKAAVAAGYKTIKKFSDKKTAIRRTFDICEVAFPYVEAEPEAAPQPTAEPEAKKATKGNSKTDSGAVVSIKHTPNFREGSIGQLMFAHVAASQGITVKELTDHMVNSYTKPRSGKPVDSAFIISTVRYFVRKGELELN